MFVHIISQIYSKCNILVVVIYVVFSGRGVRHGEQQKTTPCHGLSVVFCLHLGLGVLCPGSAWQLKVALFIFIICVRYLYFYEDIYPLCYITRDLSMESCENTKKKNNNNK